MVVSAAALELDFSAMHESQSPKARDEQPAATPPQPAATSLQPGQLPETRELQPVAPSLAQPPMARTISHNTTPPLQLSNSSSTYQHLPHVKATFCGITATGHKTYRVYPPFHKTIFESSLTPFASSRALKTTGHSSMTGHMWTKMLLEKAGCDLLEHEACFHSCGMTHRPDLLLRFCITGKTMLYVHCEVKASSSDKHRVTLLNQCKRACARLGIAVSGRNVPPPRCVLGVLMRGTQPHVAYCEGWMKNVVMSMFYCGE